MEDQNNMQHTANESQTGPMIAIVGIIVIVVIAVMGYQTMQKTNSQVANIVPTQTVKQTTASSEQTTNASAYKNGTYTADGVYTTPEGSETIGVSVTIKDGTIADTSLSMNAKHPESVEYENEFNVNYKSLVVGKNIDTVQLGKVSGSSLTGNGFNNALTKIKAEAKT